MSDNAGSRPDPLAHDPFEITVRGYSRSQVDEFIAQARRHVADLEGQLSRAHDQAEQLRAGLSAAGQAAAARPARVELTERLGHILELADEEAEEQRVRAAEETASLRRQARQEADTLRDEALKTVEQLMVSARRQTDSAVANARAQADATVKSARAEAELLVAGAHHEAEATIAEATQQARRVMEEATVRANAIREDAENRLTGLIGGHADLMQRILEIRDLAAAMAARDAARGSLSDEVADIVASALAAPAIGPGATAGTTRPAANRPAVPGTAAYAALERGGGQRLEGRAAY